MAGLLQLAHEGAELAGVSKLCRRTFTLPVEGASRPGLPRVAICPAHRHAIKEPLVHISGWQPDTSVSPRALETWRCSIWKDRCSCSAEQQLRGHITCGWSVAFCSRHCADAMGAPTLLLICGAKLKVTVDGDLAL